MSSSDNPHNGSPGEGESSQNLPGVPNTGPDHTTDPHSVDAAIAHITGSHLQTKPGDTPSTTDLRRLANSKIKAISEVDPKKDEVPTETTIVETVNTFLLGLQAEKGSDIGDLDTHRAAIIENFRQLHRNFEAALKVHEVISQRSMTPRMANTLADASNEVVSDQSLEKLFNYISALWNSMIECYALLKEDENTLTFSNFVDYSTARPKPEAIEKLKSVHEKITGAYSLLTDELMSGSEKLVSLVAERTELEKDPDETPFTTSAVLYAHQCLTQLDQLRISLVNGNVRGAANLLATVIENLLYGLTAKSGKPFEGVYEPNRVGQPAFVDRFPVRMDFILMHLRTATNMMPSFRILIHMLGRIARERNKRKTQ